MRIGVIAAMEEELQALRERLEQQKDTQYGQF
ncbi:MAG: 5'-methylthioadenosine/S-adenosylhomocysteine nucleosidase, partial [bacterium]|nr:5'-methylthioadenosine/S-adenosylhomocysteine nucleosidase [bacterium]